MLHYLQRIEYNELSNKSDVLRYPYLKDHRGPENLKKSRQKKLVKSNTKSIFSS